MEGVKDDSLQPITTNSDRQVVAAKAGTNAITVLKATRESIQTLWTSRNGEQQECNFILTENTNSKGTLIKWYFSEHVRWYPWERLGSIMNEKILGPQMEKSLDNLRRVVEQ